MSSSDSKQTMKKMYTPLKDIVSFIASLDIEDLRKKNPGTDITLEALEDLRIRLLGSYSEFLKQDGNETLMAALSADPNLREEFLRTFNIEDNQPDHQAPQENLQPQNHRSKENLSPIKSPRNHSSASDSLSPDLPSQTTEDHPTTESMLATIAANHTRLDSIQEKNSIFQEELRNQFDSRSRDADSESSDDKEDQVDSSDENTIELDQDNSGKPHSSNIGTSPTSPSPIEQLTNTIRYLALTGRVDEEILSTLRQAVRKELEAAAFLGKQLGRLEACYDQHLRNLRKGQLKLQEEPLSNSTPPCQQPTRRQPLPILTEWESRPVVCLDEAKKFTGEQEDFEDWIGTLSMATKDKSISEQMEILRKTISGDPHYLVSHLIDYHLNYYDCVKILTQTYRRTGTNVRRIIIELQQANTSGPSTKELRKQLRTLSRSIDRLRAMREFEKNEGLHDIIISQFPLVIERQISAHLRKNKEDWSITDLLYRLEQCVKTQEINKDRHKTSGIHLVSYSDNKKRSEVNNNTLRAQDKKKLSITEENTLKNSRYSKTYVAPFRLTKNQDNQR